MEDKSMGGKKMGLLVKHQLPEDFATADKMTHAPVLG